MLYPIELRVHPKEWPNLVGRILKINPKFTVKRKRG